MASVYQANIPRLLQLDEVLEIFQISKATLYRAVRKGNLPAPIRVSTRRVGWSPSEIENCINRKTGEAA